MLLRNALRCLSHLYSLFYAAELSGQFNVMADDMYLISHFVISRFLPHLSSQVVTGSFDAPNSGAKVHKIFQICKFIFFSLVILAADGCQIYFSSFSCSKKICF